MYFFTSVLQQFRNWRNDKPLVFVEIGTGFNAQKTLCRWTCQWLVTLLLLPWYFPDHVGSNWNKTVLMPLLSKCHLFILCGFIIIVSFVQVFILFQVIVSVSIYFSLNLREDAPLKEGNPFHHEAFSYFCLDWVGFHNNLQVLPSQGFLYTGCFRCCYWIFSVSSDWISCLCPIWKVSGQSSLISAVFNFLRFFHNS